MRKQKTTYHKHIAATVLIVVAVVALIVYFTKNNISLQEKMDANKRIDDKVMVISSNEKMNQTVKECVIVLYKLASSKLKRDDKSYKASEDNADAIYAAYMLGTEECKESWKKKTFI